MATLDNATRSSYSTHLLHAISHPNISHYSSPRSYHTLRTGCMPYPILILAIICVLARITPHAPTVCHIPSQYPPSFVCLLVSDPTHQLHAISHPNISHYSSPHSYQTLRTGCMPYPIPISAIICLLARIRPYAPAACHIPSQYQPLFVLSLVSDPTHPLHAISHPSISHHSSSRSYQILRTSCMPYPILILAIIRLLARIRPYAPTACHIPSQRQPVQVSSLVPDPPYLLHLHARDVSRFSGWARSAPNPPTHLVVNFTSSKCVTKSH
jgi:hypothetical protein